MKYKLIIAALFCAQVALAQSRAFSILEERFEGQPDVEKFHVRGWVGRMVASFAFDDDPKLRQAIEDIQYIRFMTIPTAEFDRQSVSVSGFRRVLSKDDFELLADYRDKGDQVLVYLRDEGNRNNRYFVLIQEKEQVVAIEMKGYIDPSIFNDVTFN